MPAASPSGISTTSSPRKPTTSARNGGASGRGAAMLDDLADADARHGRADDQARSPR